jgi:hypothetical protein
MLRMMVIGARSASRRLRASWRALLGAALAISLGAPGAALADAPPKHADITLGDEDDDGPVVADLPPTAEASRGAQLFGDDRWAEAAPLLHRVARGGAGDGPHQIELAEYRLAVALHELGLLRSSYDEFAAIAGRRRHTAFLGSMRWIARLSWELPEPAGVMDAAAQYHEDEIKKLTGPELARERSALFYWAGRRDYHARRLEQTILAQEQVEPSSAFYLKAKILEGMAYTLLRKKIPSVKAFQKAIAAVDAKEEPSLEEDRLRDVAVILVARAYYTDSIAEPGSRAATIDANRLSAAVKYWQRVRPESLEWRDALLEASWGFFMAGDYPHAIGNLYTYRSPFFPEPVSEEANLLEGIMAYTLCDYDGAISMAARIRRDGARIQRDLSAALAAIRADGGEGRLFALIEAARDGRPAPFALPRAAIVTGDRPILRQVDYARALDRERAAIDRSPALRDSALGRDLREQLALSRALVPRAAAGIAEARYERAIEELQANQLDGERLLLDAKAGQAEQRRDGPRIVDDDAMVYGQINPDHEHFIWPFDGEYWRDEIGSYRAVVASRCGR